MSAGITMTSTHADLHEQWRAMLELAASEVFEIMLNAQLNRCDDRSTPDVAEYTAMVGLAGAMCGVISLRCSAKTAGLIASRMLGVPPEEAENQTRDAIGEVCNMIGGNFKTKLAGSGSQCLLSVPTVITGADYHLHSLAEGGMLEVAMVFETSTIRITLEMTGAS
ncbi:MAG: chemotaxis protein CheX [Acidobacteriaceae bacterium]